MGIWFSGIHPERRWLSSSHCCTPEGCTPKKGRFVSGVVAQRQS